MAYWLPAIGGTLGAIEGYKRGGLGGAITGAALGAVTPRGLRMAGAALGSKLMPGLVKSGVPLAHRITSTGIGNQAALWGTGLGVPTLVGGAAGGLVGGPGTGGATPGGTASGPNVWDMQKPWGGIQGSRTLEQQRIQDQLEALDKFGAQQYKWRTQISKDELMRQLVAARERQNIATGAQLIQQGQVGAQQLGQRGLAGMNQILAQQYQYR